MNKDKAFTLVELLVAIAIFSVIAVVLYSCFRGGVISYRRIEQQAEFQQKVRHVFLKMTKDLKNMVHISSIPFEGCNEKASFVTTITERDNADINVGRVSYYLKFNDEGQVLVRKVESLKDALGQLCLTAEDIEEGGLEQPISEEPVILEGVIDFKCTYLYSNLYKIEGNAGEKSAGEEYEWVDLWETENGLPLGIKIELSIAEFEGGGQRKFYRQICIPAGKLPDTVLAKLSSPAVEEYE